MAYLIVDVETTIKNKGHPFTKANKLVMTGWLEENQKPVTMKGLEYVPEALQELLETKLVVGFNLKFDLHWLRRSGCNLSNVSVWDCQLAEFILGNQLERLPSLDGVAVRRGLGSKLDVVATEYWDKGIDTDAIPDDVLKEYLIQDLKLPEAVYLQQVEEFKKQPEKFRLFKLQCADLLVLQEMEWNGLKYDRKKSLEKAEELDAKAEELVHQLDELVGSNVVNWASNDHVSVVLYGGQIEEPIKIPAGIYKTGAKAGQVKYKNDVRIHTFPRLITPLKGTELQKPGYWSTDAKTLASLKPKGKVKQIVDKMLELTALEKLNGTYYKGIPKLMDEMCWDDDILHGNLNQCIAVTGRLSSTRPNQQNMPEDIDKLMLSRF